MMAVQPNYTFHLVDADSRGLVTKMRDVGEADMWINGGYFVFHREIFDFIEDGDELVREPFDRVMRLGRLSAYRHKGFWVPLDTIKEKQALDDMYDRGVRPWCVWEDEPLAALDEP
jgi:glucose-1-phosphate cytidylyltransferase